MTDPKEEAQKVFTPSAQPASPVSEYERERAATLTNLQRLKAERLAREASINSK
jgi:hypothetical protein